MITKEVNIDFGNESRDRGNAFGIKRSKTKRLIKNSHKALLAKDLKFNRKVKQKESMKHNSEKLKKRLHLIEDYFYPETAIAWLDPMNITPITQRDQLSKSDRRHIKSKSTLWDIEGSQAFKEFSDNTDGIFLNSSIIEIIRKIIKIDDADIIAFENWDKCTETDFTENVKNDIKRSRIRDSTDKDSILEDLLMIIIFYWQNNTIVYQQGMQDIFIPFLYLKSKEFSLAEVYAYTKGYIDMFMPNTLHSKYNGKDYSLPHLQCQLSLWKMLLKYHDIELHNHFWNLEIEVEAFATSWILTQFSRVVEFSLIYELIEIILFEKDQLMVLFMTISLLKHYKNDILKRNSIEVLLPFVQRKVKITNIRELCQLYYQAVAIRSKTPLSFAILIHKLKINDPATVISNEEMKELQNLELETFIVYPEEVLFHQNKITNWYHLYNASNNDKSMNKFYEIPSQNENDAGTYSKILSFYLY